MLDTVAVLKHKYMDEHAFDFLVKRLLESDHVWMIVLSEFVSFFLGLVVATDVFSRHQVNLDHVGLACSAVHNFQGLSESALA